MVHVQLRRTEEERRGEREEGEGVSERRKRHACAAHAEQRIDSTARAEQNARTMPAQEMH